MEVSTMDGSKGDYEDDRSVVQYATDTLLLPLRVATSPTLLRTYLRTFLLVITSTVLFVFAVIAYTSFYYSYIPIRGISVPVYLQFDHGTTPASYLTESSSVLSRETQKWPHGVADVAGLVNRQKYDVSVTMDVPRSRTNLQAGNWMLDLSLRGTPPSTAGGIKSMLGWDDDTESSTRPDQTTQTDGLTSRPPVLAHSRRPAILTYRSWVTEYLYRLLRLPLYLTGWHTESESISISMMESAYFPSSVPTNLRLELRSRTPLEVYQVWVHISARLEGLRWVMYTYKFSSLVIFVALFWATEMGVVLLTWALVTMLFGSSKTHEDDETAAIKKEPHDASDEYSDTDRTFPTLHSQRPLRYHSPPSAKTEDRELALEDIPMKEDAEADDEDDDFVLEEPVPRGVEEQGVFTDSGLGTGMDSERDGVRRRGSGRVKDERDL